MLGRHDSMLRQALAVSDDRQPWNTPEHRLLVAILQRAILDALQIGTKFCPAQSQKHVCEDAKRFLCITPAEDSNLHFVLENLVEDVESARRKLIEFVTSGVDEEFIYSFDGRGRGKSKTFKKKT